MWVPTAHLVPERSPGDGGGVVDVVDLYILGRVPVEVSLQGNTVEKIVKRPHVIRFHYSALWYLTHLQDKRSKRSRWYIRQGRAVSQLRTQALEGAEIRLPCTQVLFVYEIFITFVSCGSGKGELWLDMLVANLKPRELKPTEIGLLRKNMCLQ